MIARGPDVHFRIEDLNDNGEIEIISTEFFSQKLSLIRKINGNWKRTIIDNRLGKAFDIEIKDINADGKKDLLVTNHENDDFASVFAYEIPDNLDEKWTRHTLYSGFKTIQGGMGAGSPGEAMAVHPEVGNDKSKPLILVSGDGSQKAHILTPVSQNPDNWEYKEASFIDVGCTVGKMAVNDVDGDGMLDIFVPAYDNDKIHVLTFEKSKN